MGKIDQGHYTKLIMSEYSMHCLNKIYTLKRDDRVGRMSMNHTRSATCTYSGVLLFAASFSFFTQVHYFFTSIFHYVLSNKFALKKAELFSGIQATMDTTYHIISIKDESNNEFSPLKSCPPYEHEQLILSNMIS